MKKQTLLFSTILLISLNCFSQAFQSDSKNLSLGLGFGNSYWNNSLSSSLPVNPTISFDHGLGGDNDQFLGKLSLGGSIGYSRAKWDYYDAHYNAFFISARTAYHFLNLEKVDPYAGIGLGYVFITVGSEYGYLGGSSSGFGYSVFGGVRYFFANKVGVYGELGFSSFSFLSGGLIFKI